MKKINKLLHLFLFLGIIAGLCSCNINIKNPNVNEEPTTDNPNTNDDNTNPDTNTKDKEYSINFNVNSDNISTKDIKYVEGKKLSEDDITKDVFSNKTPTKVGYTIENWYFDKDYSIVVGFPIIVSNDMSLYLKWTRNTVNLNFYVDNVLAETSKINEGEAPANVYTPSKAGYTFDGWYTDNTYTTKYSLTNKITSNTNIYGRFIENENNDPVTTYSLAYYVDGVLHYTDTVSSSLNTVAITTPSKTGYTFDGWYTDNTYTTKFTFGNKLTTNTNVYGKFNPIATYSLAYYVDGSLYNTVSFASNVNTTAITNPTKTGYTFDGWYTTNTYSTKFTFGNKLTTNTNVYGRFNINKYNVEFYDGSNLITTQQVEYNDYAEELLSTDTNKENYTFVGWCTDSACTNQISLSTYKITQATKLYAKYTLDNIDSLSLNVTAFSGYNEGAYIEFDRTEGVDLSNYEVYYQKSGAATPTKIDSELIRENDTTIRADILGLSKGSYTITIKLTGTSVSEEKTVTVTEYDRSGYAHFNTSSGVGAYNNDGTLKSNAVVVYVSEENKNTVTATLGGKTYTGIVSILQNQSKSSYPLVVRIIGTVGAATWNQIEYGMDPLANQLIKDSNGNVLKETLSSVDSIVAKGLNTLNTTKYSALNGLTNKLKYSSSEYDSYWNMCDISGAQNVTVEGVGPNAQIFQWGFTWKSCSYIEVRNLKFDDYTEDACSFEGPETSTDSIEKFTTGHIWLHHNTFDMGVNYWDVCSEQDKHDGDGSTDIKGNIYTTFSYNHYLNCHKTGLVGGSDSVTSASITFHHNYYQQCSSRLPLGRQANMHIYNNYYYGCSTTMDIRANAYVFSESNYFESSTLPKVSDGYVKNSSTYYDATVKSFNDYSTNCTTPSGTSSYYSEANCSTSSKKTAMGTSTIVTDRTTAVTSGNIFAPNFDTNSSLFYYDSTNKKSDVAVMTAVSDVKAFAKANAGSMTGAFIAGTTSGGSSEEGGSTDGDSGSTGGSTGGSSNPVTGSTTITFNDFTTETLSTTTILNGITLIKNTKTVAVQEFSEAKTINGETINKYVSFGGGASYTDGCVQFTTTATANITVYYASGGSSERFAAIFNDTDGKLDEATTPTVIKDANTIVSYTFNNIEAGNLAIGSSGSGINIVAIVITYQ